MGRRERAVQAFCRRQNLGAGGIHFRRAWKKRRRRTILPRRSGTEREGFAGYGVSGPLLHRRGGQGAHIGAPLHGGRGPIVVSPLGGLGERPRKKSLPLTREVAFAKQMAEGETGRPHGAAPSSSQAPYRSLPPGGESSLTPLLQLSPPNPRLLPLGFGGGPKLSLFCRSVVIRRGAQCAPGPLVKGGCHRRKAVTGGFR